jgi:hypothetical protein
MFYDDNIFGWKRMQMIQLLLELEAKKDYRTVFTQYLINKKSFNESKNF